MKLSFIFAVVLTFAPCCLQAQTPTLAQAAGKVGISGNENGNAKDFEFYMDPTGYPRAVSQGEAVFIMGSWPSGNNPAMSDDKSNKWTAVTSCTDNQSTSHGFFYAMNAAAGTSVITESHSSTVGNGVFDWAHFYNMSTTSTGFVDGSSCKTGVTPGSNTAPNISGTAYTVGSSGDLILTCVYVEQSALGAPNAISSITWPSGFTGLNNDMTYGHACAYGISTTGSFTPTFTIAQGSHNTFTIMSAAFKNGSGGAAPGSGAAITLSETLYNAASGQTIPVYLPCPANTSAVVIGADAGDITNVTDSSSNTGWTGVQVSGNFYGPIYYLNNPKIGSTNSYKVSISFRNSGNYSLAALYCVSGTNGLDPAVKTQNGSTSVNANATNNTCSPSGGTCVHISSLSTSVAGDLVFDAGAFGEGPATKCVTGKCVFDYVGSNTWQNGDGESYANGDVMAHYYAPTAGAVSFDYNVASGVSTGSAISLAFLQSGQSQSSNPPAAPSGLTAVVH
jgi:hypothetical protein